MGMLSDFSLKGLADGTVGAVMKLIGDGADALFTSDEEKMAFEYKLKTLMAKRDTEIEKTVRKELDAKAEIIKAEMNQSDAYTKRARPTMVYAGLGFIFLNHVALPIATAIFGEKPISIVLPEQFWWAWGSVVSVWSVGRTAEKRKTGGLFGSTAKLITGNK